MGNDDAETIRRLQQQQMDTAKQLNDLRVCQTVKPATSSASSASDVTLQAALKVAESTQNTVQELRKDSCNGTDAVQSRLDAIEDRLDRRLDAWESSVRKNDSKVIT